MVGIIRKMKTKIIKIPKIEDPRGNLSVIEKDILPFAMKRVYYLYDVPGGAERGGHSHKEQHEFLVALSGSFDVIVNDGKEEKKIVLNSFGKFLEWRSRRSIFIRYYCMASRYLFILFLLLLFMFVLIVCLSFIHYCLFFPVYRCICKWSFRCSILRGHV